MPPELVVRFKRLQPDLDGDIPLPRYMTPQAAGMDIVAAIPQAVTIDPGRVVLLPTGFSMALPEGFEAQIRPRSGLAVRYGISLINTPGTIDADYRGEIKIAVINHGGQPFTISRGDRIAQMVICRVWQPRLMEVKELDETDRNSGGFGHTGI